MEDFGERNLPSRLVLNDAVKTLYFMQIPRQAMVCQSLTLSLIQLSDTLPLREKKDQIKSRGKIRPHTKLNLISLRPSFTFPLLILNELFIQLTFREEKREDLIIDKVLNKERIDFAFFLCGFKVSGGGNKRVNKLKVQRREFPISSQCPFQS